MLISGHGIGGQPYSAIKKNGTQAAYANGMAQLAAGHSLSVGMAKTHVVRAVTNVHGEADHNANNALYKDNLLQFQTDYETDVKATTGQAESVPMFITQISSWPRLTGDKVHDIIDGQMLAAHLAAPGKIILVGPKYHYPYFTDGVHLTSVGYDHMGEDYAKAYRRVILEGKTWEPLRPKMVTRVGKVITVKFFVPSPPLAIDTTLVSDPGKNGFEFTQTNGNAVEIESVALSGADSVLVTLTDVPTGAEQKIGYAFTGVSGTLGRADDRTARQPARLGRDAFAPRIFALQLVHPFPGGDPLNSGTASKRIELASFHKDRRARILPSDVGLPDGSRRRTPGLRREEVALLAEVGASWYTWLEQGRDIHVSEGLLERLARALKLNPTERSHLFELAQGRSPRSNVIPAESVSETLQRTIDAHPNPAIVSTPRWDVIAMNRPAILMWGDRRGTNSLWSMFGKPNEKRTLEGERHGRTLVARFRLEAGRAADREPFDQLANELSEISAEFRALWNAHDVIEEPEGAKVVVHPEAGRIELDHVALVHSEADGRTLRVTLYTPRAGVSMERASKLFGGSA